MMFNTGTNIRDYKILSKIGEGGMGSIYLAEDEMLGRKITLKVLNPVLSQDEQLIERFKQEAKVQASLIHPNIVTLHSFFREGTDYVMVMEYAEGKMLKEIIREEGKIDELRSVKILLQILEGLGFAHQRGVVHRDIKPSNIMVDSNSNIKIMDFGIAKVLGDKGLTRTGVKMGTVYYMSPEQIKALKDIDQRTDIYSLGITLYEMLTGKLPYNTTTESDFEVMNEIVNNVIDDPREINPKLSDTIVKVIMKMTGKERERRYKTCYQVSIELYGIEGNKNKYISADKIYGHREVVNSVGLSPEVEQKTLIAEKEEPKIIKDVITKDKGKKNNKKNIILAVLVIIAIAIVWMSVPKDVASSSDGMTIASGSNDKTVKIGEQIWML
ncbi:MAG: serine/threonine-protein kinase, partial [Ignavibacteriaceae bacterium]